MIEMFKTYGGKYGFEAKHLIEPSYFDTKEELYIAYGTMLDWLEENFRGTYSARAMDNAAFSDINEDPWIGFYIEFDNEEDAMAFKLRWL